MDISRGCHFVKKENARQGQNGKNEIPSKGRIGLQFPELIRSRNCGTFCAEGLVGRSDRHAWMNSPAAPNDASLSAQTMLRGMVAAAAVGRRCRGVRKKNTHGKE